MKSREIKDENERQTERNRELSKTKIQKGKRVERLKEIKIDIPRDIKSGGRKARKQNKYRKTEKQNDRKTKAKGPKDRKTETLKDRKTEVKRQKKTKRHTQEDRRTEMQTGGNYLLFSYLNLKSTRK